MLTIAPLSPALGVEIGGVDLNEPLDDETFARIKSAWEEQLHRAVPRPIAR